MKATLYTNLKPKINVENRSEVKKTPRHTKETKKKQKPKSPSHKITSNENIHKGLKTH
jgi:hypothetical protein